VWNPSNNLADKGGKLQRGIHFNLENGSDMFLRTTRRQKAETLHSQGCEMLNRFIVGVKAVEAVTEECGFVDCDAVQFGRSPFVILLFTLQMQTPQETASRATNKEFLNILWNPKCYYRVHKSPPRVLNLSQMNPTHNLTY
jgi:hypothetical protein